MDWINLITEMAMPVALAVITLLVGLAVIKGVVNVLSKQINKSKLDESLKPFIMSVISIGLKLVLVVSVVGILGIPTAPFVAIL